MEGLYDWPRGFGNLIPSPLSFPFSEVQSSRIPVHTLFTLHQSVAQNLADMSRYTFEIDAAQLRCRNRAEITLLVCEQNPIWFGFRAGERAICRLSLDFLYFYRLEYTRQDNSKKQEMGVDGPSPDLRVRVLFYTQ